MTPAASEEVQRPRPFWVERHMRTIIFFTMVLAIAGAYLAFQLPVAVFPHTSFPRVVIGIDNGVMPVEQMEVTITRPVEDAVNTVPGLETVRSITSRGQAEVDLFFNWNVNMVETLQMVNSAVAQVRQSLPPTAQITTHRLGFASFPILGYYLTSDVLPQTDLWEMATYQLKPRLNRLPGVSTVTVQGGKVPEVHVVPDPSRLLTSGTTVDDLLNAIARTNLIESPGLYEGQHQLLLGLVGGQVHSAEELAQVVVKTTAAGVPIHIGDVATVEDSTEPVYTMVTANGRPAVLLNVLRQIGSNALGVSTEVDDEVANIRKTLPPGVHIEPFYDQSRLIRDSIRSVRDAILIGLVLSSIILVVFLRDWGPSLVAGLVIPVTILVTIVVLSLTGQSFNLMTLGGLAAAVGLVIDDAIVVVENIVLHIDAGEGRIQAVRSALGEITVPLVGSTITPIVVFLPLIGVTGVTGVFFRALAITMTVSLLTSLALALTWTPSLGMVFIRRHRSNKVAAAVDSAPAGTPVSAASNDTRSLLEREEEMQAPLAPWMRRILDRYERLVRTTLHQPLWMGVGCVAIAAVGLLAYRGLGSDLLPAMDEGGFILDYLMPAGASLTETNRVLLQVEKVLHDTPEVETTSRRTGLQLGLAAVTEANRGDFTVKLKRNRSRSTDEVMEDVRQRVNAIAPQLNIEVTQMLQDNINDLSNAPEPVQIKLFSTNSGLLQQLAPRVASAIQQVPGVVDVRNGIDNSLSSPATNFQVLPAVAAQLGFNSQEVATDAHAMIEGVPTTQPLVRNGRPYTIRVRFAHTYRASLGAIQDMLLVSSTGHTATLGSLATVAQLPPQNEIFREDLQRDITVTGGLEGADLGTSMGRIQRVVAALDLPPSVRVLYGGAYQEQQRSFHELLRVLLLALALVFGVLLAEFRGFAAPVAILTSSVLSVTGVMLALLLTRTTFNVASFMGLIMVVGIVAKNGILLLDADHKYRALGHSAERAIVESGRRRLRPILMTAMAAVTGMLPLAFGIGAGSQMLQPLAIAVIGGVTLSMTLSLLVTPAIYYWLTRRQSTAQLLN
ncbi:MAG: efflux RND transporter permease subunit [Acidobacteriaceae bacterium]